jgi:hypothetical protein
MQTVKSGTKSKSTDTIGLKLKVPKPEVEKISPKNENKDVKSTKPALFLDNLSSPSDSESQNNTKGTASGFGSKTSATSNGSGGPNIKDLNYMLNRDPMKEFFHLTLQTIRMNSPHINSILNIDGDQFYGQLVELMIPFNKWGQWAEDQLNRMILSRMLKISMMNKIEKNKVPSITVSKVEEDVKNMDSKRKYFNNDCMIIYGLEVAKKIAKIAPATTRNSSGKKGFFNFGFRKKPKKVQEAEKPVIKSMFEEIMERPDLLPKTSTHRTSKHFTFPEDDK